MTLTQTTSCTEQEIQDLRHEVRRIKAKIAHMVKMAHGLIVVCEEHVGEPRQCQKCGVVVDEPYIPRRQTVRASMNGPAEYVYVCADCDAVDSFEELGT
jgi:hypothetical protein